jgi:nucleoporin GLE1
MQFQSTQLINIVKPPNGAPHNQIIYAALLSSLAKAVILQAETEVTAEKRSAGPLAHVAFTLLDNVDSFPEVFFARLVQRVGGWPIPLIVPRTDYDGTKWETDKARWKAMGYRKSAVSDDVEGPAEYTTRVAGVMRVYFHILQIRPAQRPLKPMFQAHRLWVWVARLMSEKALLESVVAAQLLYSQC